MFEFDKIDAITVKDSIFVLTGFSYDEESKIKEMIYDYDGIVKESTVVKTNYLIVKEGYDHQTVKYKRALELKEKGTSIYIIGENQFYELAPKADAALDAQRDKDPDAHIVIPEGVKTIKDSAFCGDSKLMSIILPESLTKIETRAFSGCKNLRSIVIPQNVSKIGMDAFAGCTNLTSVVINSKSIRIDSSAFELCKNLTCVTLPEGLLCVSSWLFSGCSSLENLMLPNSVKRIECGAFRDCNFSSFVIPPEVRKIGWDAFADCKNLKSITLPDDVTTVESGVFKHCKQLHDIIYSSEKSLNLVWKILDKENKNMILEKAVQKKDRSPAMVRKIKANKSALVEAALREDDAEKFAYILSLYKKISLDELDAYIEASSSAPTVRAALLAYKAKKYTIEDQEQAENEKFEKELGIKERTLSDWKKIYTLEKEDGKKWKYIEVGYVIKGYKGMEKHIVVPDTIRKTNIVAIREYAFSPIGLRLTSEQRILRRKIESIKLSKYTTAIYRSAFEDCEQLKSIEIPEGVKCIGQSAFCGCSNLTSIVLPNSVEILEAFAFMECYALESIVLSENLKCIDWCAFRSCRNLKNIIIPKHVQSIETEAFKSCRNLETIEIPESVRSIAADAFKNCRNLTICAPTGSYAENYAKKNGIKFEAI